MTLRHPVFFNLCFPPPREKIQKRENKIEETPIELQTSRNISMLIATKLIAVGETLLYFFYFFPSQEKFEEKKNKIDTSVDVFFGLQIFGELTPVWTAVCCSVLQCVAVCCSVLQCVAWCCSALRCVAV